MSPTFRVALVVALLVFIDGQASARKKPAPGPAPASACTDFYAIANQDWLLAHPLPASAGSLSRWDELNALAAHQTAELLTRSGPEAAGPSARLLADLVASGRDVGQLPAAVRTTAKPLLAKIDAIKLPRDIARTVIALQVAGVPVLYDFDVLRDPDSGQPRATFQPGTLGLPGREFYGRPEPALKILTGQYRQALVTLLTLAGAPAAKAGLQADAALTLEKSLASAMAGPGDKILTADALTKTYSSLQLSDLLKMLGAAPADVTIRQPDYFKAVDKLLAKPVVAQWQAYLRVRLMLSLADALPEDPRRAYLSTLGRAPAAAMPERLSAWIRDEGADLLDLAYADAFLGSDRQQQAQAIGEAVRAAMARAIDRATWLSSDGKAAASSKLSAMRLGIGQPVIAISHDGLAMDRDNLAANLLAVRRWNRARSLARLQAPIWPWPVDQTRSVIGYQGANNRLIVTAAALQIPVFNGESQAADFGALGSLIGQQMSLAFADLDGTDGLELGKREARLLTQYAAYAVTPSVRVDAQRTQRMNAADLSGIELSWDAYRSHAGNDHGGDQAFFRAWASLWARQDSESSQSAAAATSVFAPARWRVNGPLANLPGFAQTYACQAGPVAIWR